MPEGAEPEPSTDPGSFRAYYRDRTCPSCGFGYEETKTLEWMRIVHNTERSKAFNAALAQVCTERELDRAWTEATPGDPSAVAALEEASRRAAENPVTLTLEEAEKIFAELGVMSVDAHNVIGQNAVKTGSSQRSQNRNGTHAILQNFYEANHECRAKQTGSNCAWTTAEVTLTSLVGTGEVMNSAYCQTGQGAQCKICEAVQAEFHLLQRALFLLDNPDVPLSFVGLQWCLAFTRGARENLADAVRARRVKFLDFLRLRTLDQIESNLARLNLLIPTPSEQPSVLGCVSGNSNSELRAVVTPCPPVLVLIRQRWDAFCAFYRHQFSELCEAPPGRDMDRDSIVARLSAVTPDALAEASRVWVTRRDRPREVDARGFDCEVPANTPLYKVLTDAGFANSRKEAETFIANGKVTVNDAVLKDGRAGIPGAAGETVRVSVAKKRAPEVKTVRLK